MHSCYNDSLKISLVYIIHVILNNRRTSKS